MSQAVRIAVVGASGHMGRLLVDLIRRDRRLQLTAAIVGAESGAVGRPVAGVTTPEALRFVADWDNAGAADVVVDFSSPAGFSRALEWCEQHGAALVSGTTGIDAHREARVTEAARHIALLRSANFSLGVTLLARLLREAAAALPAWDLEIIEAHHARKEDAPSGTALSLGQAAAQARGLESGAIEVFARQGQTGSRKTGSIGFSSVRGGDIVGEHTALLAGQGERLELTHRAADRAIFARGALRAAIWLADRDPGLYSLEDVLEAED